MADQIFLKGQSSWKTHARPKSNKRNHYVLTANTTTLPPLLFLVSLKALSTSCDRNKVGEVVSDVESRLGKGMA